jgi:hypothetical protein
MPTYPRSSFIEVDILHNFEIHLLYIHRKLIDYVFYNINFLKPKREIVRKDSIRVEEKRKRLGESEGRFKIQAEARPNFI